MHIVVRMLFPLNILRMNGQNLTNVVCTLILTRSRLGLLGVIFCLFIIEIRPLIDVRITFLLNILRTMDMTKLCLHINLDKLYVWIVKLYFSQICRRVTAIDRCQNFVSTPWFEYESTELIKFCTDMNTGRNVG